MKAVYRDYMLEQLQAIMAIDSPSGYTQNIQNYLNEELKRLGFTPVNPVKNGVLAHLGGEGNVINLMAHMDTLGAMVRVVKDNGALTVINIGGLRPCNTETETVKVLTRSGKIYDGTLQAVNASAHVNPDLNAARNWNTNIELLLDEPVKSAADTRALGIAPGDFVFVNPRTTITKSGYIKSRFLDDKASVAILLAFAKMIADEKIQLNRSVWLDFTAYEEIGHGGSFAMPEGCVEALCVDMGCVGDGLQCDERMVAICAKDAGGPYDYGVTNKLVACAEAKGLNYAVDVYTNYSSDVDVTLKAGYDLLHGLIGPGVYASHGYERTHIEGLENTFKLLEAYIIG